MQITRKFSKLFSSNQTDSSATAMAATTTRPSVQDAGVISAQHQKLEQVYEYLCIMPFGTDAENETGNYKILGWLRNDGGLWVPYNHLAGAFTLGNFNGVSGEDVTDNDFIADTITVTGGLANDTDNYQILDPQDDTPAIIQVKTLGTTRFTIDMWRGTAASVNALVWFFSDSNRPA